MRPRVGGFSLIEVLLATALLAAGMALAFATLGQATIATERAETAAQRGERLRAVQAFLRRQVENALPIPYEIIEGTGEATLFESNGTSISLVAPMPGYLSRGGPYLQTFRLVRGAGGMRLEFEHQLMTPDGPLDSERKPEILLENIAEGEFEVRTVNPDGEPGAWERNWDVPATIPRLVRLNLRFKDERAYWPSLVAAPRLGLVPLPSLSPIPGPPMEGTNP